MALPQAFLQELKARCNIEDIISQHVQLKRAGSNLVGCCPFHSERTPSFTVFTGRENFYCFGCGAGGDVITFVMKMQNVDYITAVTYLADRVGLKVPEDNFFRQEKKVDRNRFFEMNKCAAKFFHNALMAPENREAYEYITGRGLTPLTLRRFGIGYADDSQDSLKGYLMSQGYSKEEIREGFLAGVSQKTGKLFDMFRNRIIFPIFDLSGNVIAFGGRIIGNGEPKYLNSSDTPVFKKSRNLYALERAKNNPESTLILCEGYMDVVALHQAGFTNAVATLGTAITPDQARIMSRYASTVYISYDSDNAGQRAAKKAIDLLTQVGINVKVIRVEDAKDPDEYIKKFGKSSFEKLLAKSNGHIDYTLSNIEAKYSMAIPEEKLRYVQECCDMLAKIYSSVEREIYIQKICEKSGVDPSVIRNEVEKKQKKAKHSAEKERIKTDIQREIGWGDRIMADSSKNLATAKKEENLLGILLMRAEYLKDERLSAILCEKIFQCEFTKRVYTRLIETADTLPFDLSLLGEYFDPDEMGRIMKFVMNRERLENNSIEVALELARALEKIASETVEDGDGSDDSFLKSLEKIKQSKK
ncbi:MAG: DNA primase [Clostridia bacterium]|nr:DNA primase [Clostridia bacterium]